MFRSVTRSDGTMSRVAVGQRPQILRLGGDDAHDPRGNEDLVAVDRMVSSPAEDDGFPPVVRDLHVGVDDPREFLRVRLLYDNRIQHLVQREPVVAIRADEGVTAVLEDRLLHDHGAERTQGDVDVARVRDFLVNRDAGCPRKGDGICGIEKSLKEHSAIDAYFGSGRLTLPGVPAHASPS